MGLRLMAELGLDGAGFRAGFAQARGVAEGVASGLKSLVVQAVGIYAVEQALAKTVETAKELIQTSERLAIAPEALQVMRQAAKDSNVEFSKLAETIEKVGVARQRALTPGEEGFAMRRAFAGFGIGMDQLKSQTSAQLLLGPIRSNALNRNPDEIGVLFRELGVRAFGQLIPFLKRDFEGLEAQMKKLGGIMDTETAVKLKMMSDELSILSQVVISNLAPALVFLAEKLFQFAGQVAGAYAYWKEIFKGPESAGKIGPSGTAVPGGVLGSAYLATLRREAKGDIPGMDPEYLAKVQKFVAENPAPQDKALEEFTKVTGQWSDQLKAIQAKIAEEADRLKHPAAAQFSQPSLPEKLSRKVLETPTDSLVRIGNFLGAGGTINRLAEGIALDVHQIAGNTRRQLPLDLHGMRRPGDAEPTVFPYS